MGRRGRYGTNGARRGRVVRPLVDGAGAAAASPGSARDLVLMNSQADIRAVLPAVQAPTLVVHRTGDRDAHVEEGRYIAGHIPGARFIELPGDTHVPFWQPDDVVDEIEEFLTGVRPAPVSERVLATLLFTDLVSSTERLRLLGDHAWAELLDRHYLVVRHELARFGGEEVNTAGDGFLALFDGPARAIRCALQSATPWPSSALRSAPESTRAR